MIHTPTYEIGTGISVLEFGVLWPVIESHGKCGCGAVEMKATIAYFTSKDGAEFYVYKANGGI